MVRGRANRGGVLAEYVQMPMASCYTTLQRLHICTDLRCEIESRVEEEEEEEETSGQYQIDKGVWRPKDDAAFHCKDDRLP